MEKLHNHILKVLITFVLGSHDNFQVNYHFVENDKTCLH